MPIHTVEPQVDHEPLTDVGNGRRFIARHGTNLRYCPKWKKWLIWDGQRWAVDEKNDIMALVKETVRAMQKAAASMKDETARVALLRHAIKSQYASRLEAMIKLAQCEPGVSVLPQQLEANEWLLNVQNGTLDLRRGKLLPHRSADLITKLAPVAYDPKATCPTWLAFLERIMAQDAGLIAFFQRVVGYALTGSTREQCLFVLHGTGANGKTTFLNALRDVFGDYAKATQPETLLVKHGNGIPNDVARLQGARLVTAAETEGGKRLAESLVKQITGDDWITARYLYQEHFEFKFTGKLFLATNHKPEIIGNDEAIWRRIHLIPFAVCIPEEERDKDLPAKLRAELPGILAWGVQGCKAWLDTGLGVPRAVRAATKEYRGEMDSVAAFAHARLVGEPKSKVAAKQMYEEYAKYCGEQGKVPTSHKVFPKTLAELGYTKKETAQGNVWVGVSVEGGTAVDPPAGEACFDEKDSANTEPLRAAA